MKTTLCVLLMFCLFSFDAFGQQETVHRRSGPRRQLATIVFAGLGGAILGLSTLSFYGRPQDHLSNIAVGFAIGVIAGTAVVTVKSATTRDYYDDKAPQGLNAPLPPLGSSEIAEEIVVPEEPKFVWAPMITKAQPQIQESNTTAVGGQMMFHF